ncbi:MAG: VCBS repeat-containing protein [Candidatus Dormibacteraeota bacterium]|nr:VCBS repeat-containing protein [Candidatus Dormibacteraeota bacterium]
MNRGQRGQSLVGAMVAMAIVLSAAGGLAAAVSGLLERQDLVASPVQTDADAASAIAAGVSQVAGQGDTLHSLPCASGRLTPPVLAPAAGRPLPAMGCVEIPVGAGGSGMPSIGLVRLPVTAGCAVGPLGSAAGQHVRVWLTATGAVSAWVDATSTGCAPTPPPGCTPSTTSSGSQVQLQLDCDLTNLTQAYVHVAGDTAASVTVRFTRWVDGRTFRPGPGSPLAQPPGSAPSQVFATDLGSGATDLVVSDPGAAVAGGKGIVRLYAGKGGGRFSQQQDLPVGGPNIKGFVVAAGRFAGPPSLVVMPAAGSPQDDLELWARPAGTAQFELQANPVPGSADGHDVGSGATAIASGPFAGGASDDLAVGVASPVGGASGPGVAIFQSVAGTGAPTFQPYGAQQFIAGPHATAMVALDLGGHGGKAEDLAIADRDARTIFVERRQAADGTFAETQIPIPGGPVAITSGAFGPGRYTDLAVADATGDVTVVQNNGTTLTASLPIKTSMSSPCAGSNWTIEVPCAGLAAGDVTGDGNTDLVLTGPGSAVFVLLGRNDGTFVPVAQPATVGKAPLDVAAVNFGSGATGFVSADSGLNQVSVRIWNTPPWGAAFLLAAPSQTPTSTVEEADVLVSADASVPARLAFAGAI